MYDIELLLNDIVKNKKADVTDVLNLNLSEEKYKELMSYLLEKNIEIIAVENENSSSDEMNAYHLYKQQISKYPILSEEEEKKLFILSRNGDKKATEKLILSNLRLVICVAKRYRNKCNSLDFFDLIQEGNIGLQKAIQKFDVDKNFRLSTYAVWWIEQSIKLSLYQCNKSIKVPTYLQNKLSKYKDYRIDFFSKNGRYPTIQEISKDLNTTLSDAKNLLLADIEIISFDIPVSDENETTLIEVYADSVEDFSYDVELKVFVEELVLKKFKKILTEKEYKTILMRNGLYFEQNGSKHPLTLEEIGQLFNVTKERIRQCECKAYEKIRKKEKNYL